MNYSFMNKYHICILVSVLVISACDSSSVEYNYTHTKKYDEGWRIELNKREILTTRIGILSGHDYGTRRTFNYSFKLSPGRIKWKNSNAEPRNIVFCENEIYLHSVGKVLIKSGEKYKNILKNKYELFIDERFFFKLLGDQYWLDITKSKYIKNSKLCLENKIPNDGEYKKKNIRK